MRLKSLELTGFKSFAKKTAFVFQAPITSIVGPNGSGKSNCAEAFRWALGEKSMRSLRGKRGEDLIFHGGGTSGKMNRAAVTLIFDNHDRKCDVDFDEVAITREVYRDGTNVYLVNGSPVRYRQLVELLAKVSLGSNGHFIISQGEADRLLGASPSERRSLVEDALGLRLYQWKIAESEKKLEQTEVNLKQVESLRRELAPHLRYLQKQVEKIRQADELRAKLKTLYLEYLRREDVYIHDERNQITAIKLLPQHELTQVEQKLSQAASLSKTQSGSTDHQAEVDKLDASWRQSLGRIDELTRRLGRLEGMIEVKASSEGASPDRSVGTARFSDDEVNHFVTELNQELEQAEKLSDLSLLQTALGKLKSLVANFWRSGERGMANQAGVAELEQMKREQAELEEQVNTAKKEATDIQASRDQLQATIKNEVESSREAERELLEWRARRSELSAELNVVKAREEKLALEEEDFKRQIAEGQVLVGQEIANYRELSQVAGPEDNDDRGIQQERRRQIERLKIRLEDMQVESGDTMKEFKDATEREEFLVKEVADLEAGALSLRQIIAELRTKIDEEFKSGVEKINTYFQEFFALMFDGGTALLKVVKETPRRASRSGDDEDEEDVDIETRLRLPEADFDVAKEGIEVVINLPRKKVKGLEMLSGGERALCSIALLFAMSQVNPPPFLVLDETDAALDEANSRKYGTMVSNLAKHSQLILITHNRETMSHAGVIYGVTMGSDGISKLLSIKFDEAVGYAK